MLALTACDENCNPNGPDPITPIVTGKGTYERVYSVTHPDFEGFIQIIFEKQDNGVGAVENADQVSENLYSFENRLLYADASYKMFANDHKVGDIDLGKKFTLNGYEFQGGDKGYVLFRLNKDGIVYELFD